MKLGKVRVGERFVFDDRGGVFQRVSWEKARCIYGSSFGTEIDINPDISVYAIFDREKSMRMNKREPEQESPGPVTNDIDLSVPVPANVPVPEAMQDHPSEYQPPIGGAVPVPAPTESGIRITFIDEHDKVVSEIACASAAEVSALTKSDFVKLKVGGTVKVYRVSDVGYDYPEQTLCLSVDERD